MTTTETLPYETIINQIRNLLDLPEDASQNDLINCLKQKGFNDDDLKLDSDDKLERYEYILIHFKQTAACHKNICTRNGQRSLTLKDTPTSFFIFCAFSRDRKRHILFILVL